MNPNTILRCSMRYATTEPACRDRLGLLPAMAGWLFVGLLILPAAAPADDSQIEPARLTMAAEAIVKQQHLVGGDELARWLIEERRDYQLIDVRPAAAYAAAHIDGAVSLPLRRLFDAEQMAALSTDQKLVLYGDRTLEAAQAAVVLRLTGRDAYALQGGLEQWALRTLSPEAPPAAAPQHEQLDAARRAAIARALKNCDMPCYEPPAPSGGYTPPLAPVETTPAAPPASGGGVLLDEGC